MTPEDKETIIIVIDWIKLQLEHRPAIDKYNDWLQGENMAQVFEEWLDELKLDLDQ